MTHTKPVKAISPAKNADVAVRNTYRWMRNIRRPFGSFLSGGARLQRSASLPGRVWQAAARPIPGRGQASLSPRLLIDGRIKALD